MHLAIQAEHGLLLLLSTRNQIFGSALLPQTCDCKRHSGSWLNVPEGCTASLLWSSLVAFDVVFVRPPCRERAVKQQLTALTQQRVAAARSGAHFDNELDEDGSGVDGGSSYRLTDDVKESPAVDEEGEREGWLLQLDLYALKVSTVVYTTSASLSTTSF